MTKDGEERRENWIVQGDRVQWYIDHGWNLVKVRDFTTAERMVDLLEARPAKATRFYHGNWGIEIDDMTKEEVQEIHEAIGGEYWEQKVEIDEGFGKIPVDTWTLKLRPANRLTILIRGNDQKRERVEVT
jgi:hypothetical protein